MNTDSIIFTEESIMEGTDKKKVVVIGGGIAGLSAGIYALLS